MAKTFRTISPIDGSVYVERSYADREHIEEILEKAKNGQRVWKDVTLAKRKKICAKAIDAFVAFTGSIPGCSLSKIGYESLTRPKSFHIKLP